MILTDEMRAFIRQHSGDEPEKLLLDASRYRGIDVPLAATQIAARRQIRTKLPQWFDDDRLIFPSRLAAEQCSSEKTALYKQRLLDAADETLTDLTGGLGVDSYYFSQKISKVHYIERSEDYCEAARHNFAELHADIEVTCGDATQMLPSLQSDVMYIDPARRADGDRRVYALSDCEPDLTLLLPEMLRHTKKVIAKLSPMADISHTLELLPGTVAVHVLSVRNECKELLFVIQSPSASDPVIHCVNFTTENGEQHFSFHPDEEQQAEIHLADEVRSFLYEPSSSLLKAGAFKSLCQKYPIEKLAVSSHLYTSINRCSDFPGRIFCVHEVIPFNRQCRTLSRTIPQANIAVRNFPLSVSELRRRTGIADGGDVYLFATTLSNGAKVIIKCGKSEKKSL